MSFVSRSLHAPLNGSQEWCLSWSPWPKMALRSGAYHGLLDQRWLSGVVLIMVSLTKDGSQEWCLSWSPWPKMTLRSGAYHGLLDQRVCFTTRSEAPTFFSRWQMNDLMKMQLWQDPPPLDLSFWSFLTFLHHGIDEVERHLLWKFYKKNSKEKLVKCDTEVARLHRVSIQSCTQNRPSPKVQSLSRDWI